MGLTDRISGALGIFARSQWPSLSFDDYLSLVTINGNSYLTGGLNTTIRGNVEEIDNSFASLAQQAYMSNGIVYACFLARSQLFSEARFQFQRFRNGRPGELFGGSTLDILEHPWPNGVTGDLLRRAIQDHDLAGNFFATRRNGRVVRLRPDWVTLAVGSYEDPEVEAGDIDAEVLGIIYHPGGRTSGRPAEVLLPGTYMHFMAEPDPLAWFRGMSWLTPVVREIAADKAMTEHKALYLANGGTPNLVVSLDKDMKQAATPQAFGEWVEAFKKFNGQRGFEKFKTMYLAGGTTASVLGSNMEQMDFKAVQGAGETRIAAAAGVPPVIAGFSEGLGAATYSNYAQARRRFADNTMRPLWRNFAGSAESICPPPTGARLWYDDRDIQALAEDKKDLAEVRNLEAQQISALITAGYKPDAIIEAVTTGDFDRLKGNHSGLYSVQLQPPMPEGPPAPIPQITAPDGAAKEVQP